MRKYEILVFAGLTAVLAGCAKQVQVEQTMPICMGSVSMDQVFSSAESVLTGMQFQIDKADRDVGQIVTRPLRGGQFFEVWRQDNATGADAAESNLHSIQRIAEVRFDRVEDQVCANCRVIVRRLSLTDPPIQGRSRASGLFTDSTRRRQTLRMTPETAGHAEWIYLGTDPALEQVILQKIEKSTERGIGR